MKKIQVLILAGGMGKRMKPLSGDKLLLPMLGKPLISWLIDDLEKAGVEKITLVGNKENLPKLQDRFKEKRFSFYLQEKAQGMADAILSVKKFTDCPLLILNADDLFSPDFFKNFLKFVEKEKEEVILTGIEKEKYFPGGYFVLKEKGVLKEVEGLVEKPGKGKEPSKFVRLVADYFKNPTSLFNVLKKTKSLKDDIYEVALDKIIKEEKVGFYGYKGSWATIKYPWHILDFQELLLKERLKKSFSQKTQIAENVKIKGEVVIEEGVRIFEGAVIMGPTFIGKNSIIGNYSLVRESQVAEDCLIGSGMEIARSYVGPDCWLHRNYIGDSVLEEDVRFGAGAVTANFRLDEKEINFKIGEERYPTGKAKLGAIIARGARIGVNASLMPGVSIGENAWVGPGVVLKESLAKGERKKQ